MPIRALRLALRTLAALAAIALGAGALSQAHAAAPGSGLDRADLDTTCRACDDFWGFATGGWRKHAHIPPGYAAWGSFDEVYERNLAVLHGILDRSAADAVSTTDPDERRVGALYAACTDTAAIESGGFVALQPELDRIAAVSSPSELVSEIARLDRAGVDTGLAFNSEADTRDSSRTIAFVGYGGLGMPDRDYYLAPKNAAIRTAYRRYLRTQLVNLGDEPAVATREAAAVLALETAFARATPPSADLRDPLATYHPTRVAALARLAPHVGWTGFFAAFGEPDLRSVDVQLPKFTTAYDRAIERTPLATWRALLRVHLVNSVEIALPARFDRAYFAFYSRTLQGTNQQLPRWKRCAELTDAELGDELGKIYVAQAFPPAAKARARALVVALQAALRGDIATLPWMSPPTRREAERKLAAYTKKIGYPDRWIDYSSVQIAPSGSLVADLGATRAFSTARTLARIGKPTDRGLWGMTPPTVNAYYNPSNNEIVFPAGILQAPFFNPDADDAVNYGAIGAVIGHEMTHGFDDQGRQYDAAGNLRDWWTPADAARFKARAQCIVDQFNGYSVEKGVHENGRLVQGEAIADLGGTTIAYRAFSRTPEFRSGVKIDGYTPQQRFFIAYAQAWRELLTPEAAREATLVDPHPQNNFRLIGTVGNMPEFAAAFGCPMRAPMVRPKRCSIW